MLEDGRVVHLVRRFIEVSGEIPAEIGELTELTRLDLSFNQKITGSIPREIGNLTKLKYLDLSGNRMTGSLPSEMQNLTLLEDLFLHTNRIDDNPGFSGEIPAFIGNLTRLQQFEIDYNSLSGTIPEELGNLTNVVDLFLSGNELTGAVPATFAGLSSIEILGIQDNDLEDLPDLSPLSATLLGLFAQNNRFTFEDFEPNFGIARNANSLWPQDSVATAVSGSGELSVDVGGQFNEYQWYREGFIEIPGATSPSFTPEEPGLYFCAISNTAVPGWLYSRMVRSEGAATDIVVNLKTDEGDANVGDEVCDVAPTVEGSQCTLRAAIQTANQLGTDATISFNVPETGDVIIAPTSAYPVVTAPVTIDGSTQPGGIVQILGSNAGPADGLVLGADDITIHGLIIGSFEFYGLRVNAGTGHVIQNNIIGMDPAAQLMRPNRFGGILADQGVTDVTIGGMEASDENVIGGGVRILGDATRGVRILRNRILMPIPDDTFGPFNVPVDLGNDGPTCIDWAAAPSTAPNRHLPPPHILTLTPSRVEGLTRPNHTVVVYRVTNMNIGRGRYFPRGVQAVAMGTADGEGRFDIPVSLADGTSVTLTTMDADGNTSELSQLRRPAIYLPGVGGSWLEGEDGANLWLPGSGFDSSINDLLARMAMAPDGTDVEPITVDGIVEAGGYGIYGPILAYLHGAGYTGFDENVNPRSLDLWRFPYDWRRDVNIPVEDLKDLIDRLVTGSDEDVALSCQVDLVSHSNGGMVAGLYVRKYEDHSRRHVHRLITSGTPYLGSTQVAAAHTRGYIFGIDELDLYPIDVEWGRITDMFRNLPGAYGLMPSRLYWDAVDPNSDSHLSYYLEDLAGRALRSYDTTLEFMTAPKLGTLGRPEGLGRNRSQWIQQQQDVHELINDWRSWEGPPQIFRMVGDLEDANATGWVLPTDVPISIDGSVREEPGDTPAHVVYREGLFPIPGLGDGTVPLVSATLGRDPRVGRLDLSGVDESPWIEEFEYWPCLHVPLVGSSCFRRGDGLSSLERTVQILISGYQVVAAASAGKSEGEAALAGSGRATPGDDPGRNLFFIQTSAEASVIVTSDSGFTGPIDPNDPSVIEAGLPGVFYWASRISSVVSIPDDGDFTLEVHAPDEALTVRVVRAGGSPGSGTQVVFPDQELAAGGTLLMELISGGTAEDAGFELDADGDGAFEGQVEPAVQFTSNHPIPDVPEPDLSATTVEAIAGAIDPCTVELIFPETDGPDWSYSLSELPVWVEADAETGAASGAVTLTLDADQLEPGVHTADFTAELALGGYTRALPLSFDVTLREAAPVLTEIVLSPDEAEVAFNSALRFTAAGFDQAGLPLGFHAEWSATGGTIDDSGLFFAGADAGLFMVTVTDPETGLSAESVVDIKETVVSTEDAPVPETFVLEPNYPNPFNPSTTIRFGLPAAAQVQLDVFDVLGRRVALLVNEALPPGMHRVRFDAGHLPSGTYLFALKAGGQRMTGSMVLVK